MFRKYIIPLVALAGVAFAVFTVVRGDKTPPSAPPISEALQSPGHASVAGSGIVEASTENISIGTQIAGIVSKIFVRIGSDVKAGDPLFEIDDRSLLAELNVRRATVQVAEAQLADAQYELGLAESLSAKRITSVEDLQKNRFAAQKAEAQLAQARAELKSSETDLERLTVRAPVDGQVLQLKVHLGEFAPVAATAAGEPPLILLGSVTPLHVRVDVDENDAWRVRAGAPAIGYLRGNKNIKTPLTFVRFEPYVVPKKSLTGDSAERVDTRVLQVIFSFKRGDLPIFVGQQMDVFVDTPEATQSGSATINKSGP
jgi:RND family efflux transporter MFP subunit